MKKPAKLARLASRLCGLSPLSILATVGLTVEGDSALVYLANLSAAKAKFQEK